MTKIVHFGDLDYIVREQDDKFVLKSTTKNKYGYNRILEFPREGDKNSFQRKIEEFLLREIL